MITALLILATDPRKPYRPGQQRRIRGVRTQVTSAEQLTLGDVTHDQARALGHKGTAALKRDWLDRHDHPWLMKDYRSEHDQLQRFAQRWAHRDAVLVRYVAVGTPRFMVAGPGDDGRGYSANPARSIDPDAECVDDATLRQYAKTADAFCIGRQLARAREAKARKSESPRGVARTERGRSWRDAA